CPPAQARRVLADAAPPRRARRACALLDGTPALACPVEARLGKGEIPRPGEQKPRRCPGVKAPTAGGGRPRIPGRRGWFSAPTMGGLPLAPGGGELLGWRVSGTVWQGVSRLTLAGGPTRRPAALP